MKCAIAVLVTLVLFYSPSDGAETDVVRIFDPNFKMTLEEMQDILKNASLEDYGFVATEQLTTETDENGYKTTKKTILYSVTDECSKVEYWEHLLQVHFPKKLISSKMVSDVTKEVRSRIQGRKTKYCEFGLEFHQEIVPATPVRSKRDLVKRSVDEKCCCCCKCKIAYESIQ